MAGPSCGVVMKMRLKALFLAAVCAPGLSCSSVSEVETPEARFLDYSLAFVDGHALPGPASSLPGLLLWEGGDGSMLAVWMKAALKPNF